MKLRRPLNIGWLLMIASASLTSCASQPSRSLNCEHGATVSPKEALHIALRYKGIVSTSEYETSVDRYELGYIVYFNAKEEGKATSFGTVSVDFCGEVTGVSAPL